MGAVNVENIGDCGVIAKEPCQGQIRGRQAGDLPPSRGIEGSSPAR